MIKINLLIVLTLLLNLFNGFSADWVKYKSVVGNFNVIFPSNPAKDQKSIDFDGHQVDFYRFYSMDSKNNTYLVGYIDLSEDDYKVFESEIVLNKAKERLIKGLKADIKSESPISFEKYKGKLFNAEVTNGLVLNIKLILVNRRLYQIVVSGNKGIVEKSEIEKFLNSFSLFERDFYEFTELNSADLEKADENVVRGNATKKASPEYPAEALAAGIAGDVIVSLIIDINGKVIASRVKSGPLLLQEPSLLAVRQWKFKPTLLRNNPVKVLGYITFRFQP
jgi:TonB family protein